MRCERLHYFNNYSEYKSVPNSMLDSRNKMMKGRIYRLVRIKDINYVLSL